MADLVARRCVTLVVVHDGDAPSVATPAPLVTAWVLADLPTATVLALGAGRIDLCLPVADESSTRARLDRLLREPRFGTWELAGIGDAAGSGPGSGPLLDLG